MDECGKAKAIEIVKNLLDILSIEMIARKMGLIMEEVLKLKEEVDKKL